MRLPDRLRIAWVLLRYEIRGVFAAKSLWAMLLVLSPLVGYSFIQAVSLFGEASKSALEFPELRRGMTPLDGVLVPTLGSLYLAITLLFPFVAIRVVGQDKQSGAAKLAEQYPVGAGTLLAVKSLAVGVAWCLAMIPALSATAIWAASGGHVHAPELINLLLGHALYAFAVTGIAFFAAAIADSVATAAIVALAFTLGFWVLDFAAGSSQLAWVQAASRLSLTALLRQFEHGLFGLPQVLESIVLGLSLIVAAGLWLPGGRRVSGKISGSLCVAAVAGVLLAVSGQAAGYRDFSEDRRNSFGVADEKALAFMFQRLVITLNLSPDDSRLKDIESNVLSKLRRQVSALDVRFGDAGRVGLFGSSGDDRYGVITYEYAGKKQESRSSDPREILSIIHGLAGVAVPAEETTPYPGYPLVADVAWSGYWFYLGFPLLTVLFWRLSRMAPRRTPGKEMT